MEQVEQINAQTLDQIEMLEGANQKDDQQSLNEMVANVPLEFEVNGVTLHVRSKTITEMVQIDGKIGEIEKLSNTEIEYDENTTADEYVQQIQDKNIKIVEIMVDILALIVNQSGVDKQWIKDNIDVGEGGIGEQIIDAYNYKCTPRSMVKKILFSKKFS